VTCRLGGAEELDEVGDATAGPKVRSIDADAHGQSLARGANVGRYFRSGPPLKANRLLGRRAASGPRRMR
jgi:hypothetical protein